MWICQRICPKNVFFFLIKKKKAKHATYEKGSTTAGDDTLLNSGTGSVESIVVPVLLLSDLNLARTTNLDNGNTATELGQSLLELGPVVIRSSRIVDQSSDLLASRLNEALVTLTVEDNSVLLGDSNGASSTEHVGGSLLKLDVEFVSEDGTAGEDGNVTEDRLSVVAESGGLDGSDGELTSKLVENDSSKRLAVNVLGNDQQRSTGLGGNFEGRKDVLKGRDLLLGEEDEGLLELNTLVLGVGDEVRGNEASVESHTLGNLNLVVNGSALLDGDDTLLADLLHSLSNNGTDVSVTVGGDGGDLAFNVESSVQSTTSKNKQFFRHTWAISSEVVMTFLLATRTSRTLSTAFWAPRRRSMGLQPAATFFTPSE